MGGVGQKRLAVIAPSTDQDSNTLDRRAWLQRAGATLAIAGVPACGDSPSKILPYTTPPRDVTPTVPRYYATTLVRDGFGTGVLVESHEGRPTKIEGNPDHPASRGATSPFEQAAILGLYDQDRARGPRTREGVAGVTQLFSRFAAPRRDRGEGLRFLLEPTASPLLRGLIARVRDRFPRARFTFHAAAQTGFPGEGGALAFGRAVQPAVDVRAARVILSLDDDFLYGGPFSLRYARDFAAARRVSQPDDAMNRLYVVETMPTVTGSMADHRLRRRPSEIVEVALEIAAAVAGGLRPAPEPVRAALARAARGNQGPETLAIAGDLAAHAGESLVTVGERQPPLVHAIAHLINTLLGNDRCAGFIPPVLVSADEAQQSLASLAREMGDGHVDTLVVLEGNPVYSAPADLDLSNGLRRVPTVLYLGAYEDETAALASWFVPAAHPLESWGDAAAYDGTVSLVQPLIDPLFGGRTPAEMLAMFSGVDYPDGHRMLRERWAGPGIHDAESTWKEVLMRGVVLGSASAPLRVSLDVDAVAKAIAGRPTTPAASLEVAFALDPTVWDGKWANNPWLQELPKPLTKLTWDNAAMMSPKTAARIGVTTEDVVAVVVGGRRLTAPVFVVPGHADDALTLPLGYGRSGAEHLAAGLGFNSNLLRTSGEPWFARGIAVSKVPGKRYELAATQLHFSTEGRPIAPHTTRDRYREDPDFTHELRGPLPSLMPKPNEGGDQWAMTIDTTACVGCSACVVACQAENNVLVVGKDQVRRGREMHWLRIDTYRDGPAEDPTFVHEPMACQHCEKAPCEYVCPVEATVHSPDGLNEMVYNRCVGTRFCSNNCPYKVRRFNWFDWSDAQGANRGLVELQRNPDVTVRERGVMEKCTYCVQRIREAEIKARVAGRPIAEWEVVTACAAACPTEAIQFGSLRHANSKMVNWRNEPRAFYVLHDLGTVPRTAYLARIDNPNGEMPPP